ncbi:MAG: SLOG family protein [Halothece sp.]
MTKAFFTGHRAINDRQTKAGINQLIDIALEQGVLHFFCGMAIGTDQLAAAILVNRKLPWTAVIPCADQAKLWSQKNQEKYKKLLTYANQIIVLYPQYSPGVMQSRNLYMIERSQLCLAIYDGRDRGGTKTTINLAIARNLSVIAFNPKLEKINRLPRQLSLF